MRITFFKTGTAKQFKYTPRYYNERKEEFEERKKRIERELGMDSQDTGFQSRITRGVMSERLALKRKFSGGSTLRILVLIAILTLLALYLLKDYESILSFIK